MPSLLAVAPDARVTTVRSATNRPAFDCGTAEPLMRARLSVDALTASDLAVALYEIPEH